MSRIMILGAGRGLVELIRSVKKYGHTAVVASIPGAYPGFEYADEVCYVDITDPIAVEREVLTRGIDAITTCCIDTGMETLGYICEKHHFPGPSEQAAKTARDKLLMKEKFLQGNVRTAKYRKVSCREELSAAADELAFPLIVKAVDQQGSKGINIAETADELCAAWEATMADTLKEYCIVEEYITGPKHGANGCIIDGKLIFFLPSRDITDKTSVLGHIFPFEATSSILADIEAQSLAAVHALGLDNCVFNVDFILHDDLVYIIEATGRLGSNGIPELLSLYYGIDIYEILINIACGRGSQVCLPPSPETACCSGMLISKKTGILEKIVDQNPTDPDIVSITYFVSTGDEVRAYHSARDCVGQIIVRGKNASDCAEKLDRIMNNIHLVLEER